MNEKGTKILGIIQARMGSSRLPGKMLLPIIDGKGALELMIERVRKCSLIYKLIVATTTNEVDAKIADICERLNVPCFRGSEDDVLDRFYQAYKSVGEDFSGIVRLTGDCPLHDPEIIDLVVKKFLDSKYDYVSNVDPPSYPDGLDAEVFTFAALEKAWKESKMKSQREHVTLYIRNYPEFRKANVQNQIDLSHLRWTLDEEADLQMIREVYKALYHQKKYFGMNDVINLLTSNPDIQALNLNIKRNQGLLKSLANDQMVSE